MHQTESKDLRLILLLPFSVATQYGQINNRLSGLSNERLLTKHQVRG
jgi:hypothetical protein